MSRLFCRQLQGPSRTVAEPFHGFFDNSGRGPVAHPVVRQSAAQRQAAAPKRLAKALRSKKGDARIPNTVNPPGRSGTTFHIDFENAEMTKGQSSAKYD
jgi:hypothetical protein